ncbi:CHAP domain-containing protein [Spirillospora sp. NPDC029432]|uniref:CHAP domain-containing protein n=1 Tax=Spirillospora sp. NPDC029432 TaxID=3154599 RepID=UPI0034535109
MDPIGKKLLEIAEDNLGYTEKGDGYTKFGDWWTKTQDSDHNPYFKTAPWCDMFLAWAAEEAGVEEQAGQFAATVDHAKWFKKHDAWGTKPEPGALVFFDWNGSNDIDQIDHVGLVEKVDGKTIHTIEANADGYKLMRKKRDMDTIVGFGYPGKVEVKQEKYTPKHAAPAPKVESLTGAAPKSQTGEKTSATELPAQEALLTGALAFVLCGTVALAAGKAAAAKAPTASPIRVRKRGKHHRVPVQMPADLTPADLDAAENETTVMPALSLAAAHEAEDREFWGRIAHFEEDDELAFWDSLHAESTLSSASKYASAPSFR